MLSGALGQNFLSNQLLLTYDLQYDKSFTHGISAATGQPFQEPQETRRMDGNPDVWEGLCGSCNEWVALVSSKKKGTTWFRHAYKVSFISFHFESPSTHHISFFISENLERVDSQFHTFN